MGVGVVVVGGGLSVGCLASVVPPLARVCVCAASGLSTHTRKCTVHHGLAEPLCWHGVCLPFWLQCMVLMVWCVSRLINTMLSTTPSSTVPGVCVRVCVCGPLVSGLWQGRTPRVMSHG